ncbi:chemotaxis protein CheW [Desulfococcaceae bacterium HSG7]|nr:chemotaxis protein CheW [Desulfococcaceae bacterium HSG7]
MSGNISSNVGERKVLIFPAMTPTVGNNQIYFLFSIRQVEDIIQEINICPVPFAPSYTEGLGWWREQTLPVISLEACLGLEIKSSRKDPRFMLIRSAAQLQIGLESGQPAGSVGAMRSIIKVHRSIRLSTLPIKCAPVEAPWIPNREFVRGAYEWDEGFLIVTDINTIFN